jgi:hypothetical protein
MMTINNKGIDERMIKEMAKTPPKNQPCPCGSDKKYKMCCGSENTVLEYWDVKKVHDEKVKVFNEKQTKDEWNKFRTMLSNNVKYSTQPHPAHYDNKTLPKVCPENVKKFIKDFDEVTDMELKESWGFGGDDGYWSFQNDYGILVLGSFKYRKFIGYKDVQFDELYDDNSINVEWIVSNKDSQNSGWGREIMETLTTLQDIHDVTIYLHACNGEDFDMRRYSSIGKKYLTCSLSNDELVDWYRKFGFDNNPSSQIFHTGKDREQVVKENLILPSKQFKESQTFPSFLGYKGEFNYESSLNCMKQQHNIK